MSRESVSAEFGHDVVEESPVKDVDGAQQASLSGAARVCGLTRM